MKDNKRALWLRNEIEKSIASISKDPVWNQLLDFFQLTKSEIVEQYFQYEYDVYSYGNEIYNSIEIRFVLFLLSKKPNSWHIKKQNIVDSWIKEIQSLSIADVGFGVPQKYHLNLFQSNWKGNLALIEYNLNALLFAKQVISFYFGEMTNVCLINGAFFKSSIADKNIQKPDLWIFLDSIEHFEKPEKVLEKCYSFSGNETKYIFSLPIGECVPVHSHSWKNRNEAFAWLKMQGFKIHDFHMLHPNPEIEWFVHSLRNYNTMKELIILASK